MKDKKTKKFLKAAKKLIKKIRKHGKDGEVLLLEIKKLFGNNWWPFPTPTRTRWRWTT